MPAAGGIDDRRPFGRGTTRAFVGGDPGTFVRHPRESVGVYPRSPRD